MPFGAAPPTEAGTERDVDDAFETMAQQKVSAVLYGATLFFQVIAERLVALALMRDLDTFDVGPARPRVRPADERLHGFVVALEHGLDGAIRPVRHPAGEPGRLRPLPSRVAKEDALDAPVDDDALPHPRATALSASSS